MWWRLFTAPPPPPDIPIPVIVDELGQWQVDFEYVRQGEREGWLKLTGYHWLNGQLYFRYSQV